MRVLISVATVVPRTRVVVTDPQEIGSVLITHVIPFIHLAYLCSLLHIYLVKPKKLQPCEQPRSSHPKVPDLPGEALAGELLDQVQVRGTSSRWAVAMVVAL